jgi:hypothetical protein
MPWAAPAAVSASGVASSSAATSCTNASKPAGVERTSQRAGALVAATAPLPRSPQATRSDSASSRA